MLTFLIAATVASTAPDWRDVDAQASAIADEAGLARLAQDFPNSATIQRRVLIEAFQAQDRGRAMLALERLQKMGYGLSAASFEQLAGLVGTDAAATLSQEAAWRHQPIGSSETIATVDPEVRLAEGVAFDMKTGRIFVGSVVGRSLHMIYKGDIERLEIEGLGSVFGLAIDPQRRLLWLASGKVDPTPEPETAFVGLVALDLETLKERARFAAPDRAASLNDIAVGTDGSVMAADAVGGGIYRLADPSGRIEMAIAPNRLRGPQGIAIADGRAYIADYGYGIAMLDLETGSLGRLEGGEDVMLDGVDGLYWSGGSLVAVQNGIRPMRISRLDLDDNGTRVVRQVTLERANPAWGEPTLGQVDGDRFIYISDPQWERFGEGGALTGEEPLKPNPVRALKVR